MICWLLPHHRDITNRNLNDTRGFVYATTSIKPTPFQVSFHFNRLPMSLCEFLYPSLARGLSCIPQLELTWSQLYMWSNMMTRLKAFQLWMLRGGLSIMDFSSLKYYNLKHFQVSQSHLAVLQWSLPPDILHSVLLLFFIPTALSLLAPIFLHSHQFILWVSPSLYPSHLRTNFVLLVVLQYSNRFINF